MSCLLKDDQIGCLSCYNSRYVGYKNQCIKQCPSNYESTEDGEKFYCKKIDCFHSCSTCIGPSYNECITCPASRKLEVYHGAFVGQCTCISDDYTDVYK